METVLTRNFQVRYARCVVVIVIIIIIIIVVVVVVVVVVIEKSFVTNCLLTFSTCCVGNDYGVRGKIPVNFSLLFFIAWMTGISGL